jgi:replicative superfamily II helicase
MAFKTRKKEEFSYSSPQEMYQDNKFKKIMGPLDYQAAMLNLYIENADKKTVALELPTGSGKTLVGLLIGEYRRRKNKEKVLFLCPTNQLVHQVVEQANSKYGLRAIAFCGKQKDYLPKDKSSFLMGEAIGVTTYSSFFALHSFFDDVDILIMDDVHSCEDYIISIGLFRLMVEILYF